MVDVDFGGVWPRNSGVPPQTPVFRRSTFSGKQPRPAMTTESIMRRTMAATLELNEVIPLLTDGSQSSNPAILMRAGARTPLSCALDLVKSLTNPSGAGCIALPCVPKSSKIAAGLPVRSSNPTNQ
jgi:hypothetical protein